MDGRHDLEVILRSRTPIIVIETRDEPRILDMLKEISVAGSSEQYMPLVSVDRHRRAATPGHRSRTPGRECQANRCPEAHSSRREGRHLRFA